MMSHPLTGSLPRLALTLGDVAGIGPECVARALSHPEMSQQCEPIVVGDPEILEKAFRLIGKDFTVRSVTCPEFGASSQNEIVCWNPTKASLTDVTPGNLSADAGQAAYDWLVSATAATLEGKIDAIVTAPLNKAALHLAGHPYPGHTEILAEQCGVRDFAMMLYLPQGEIVRGPFGLGVAHVTLHTSIASVPGLLNVQVIGEKIHLVDNFLKQIGCKTPRVGVCALNPHAGEGGLFGNEEATLIAPAVKTSRTEGVEATGPLPADTLLQRAVGGEYDGIVAMYHDQGHIALKLIGFQRAVNVTLGLPIVRTSPSHGTAFDIAWQGIAEGDGMMEAIKIAVELSKNRDSEVE